MNTIFQFCINNWAGIILAIAAIAVAAYAGYHFAKMPTSEQINKVREWLLYAVCKAEKEFGSNTGAIKLRYVYDAFVGKFPALANTISFESFSLLVDEVLEKFKTMLNSNQELQAYVGEAAEIQTGDEED